MWNFRLLFFSLTLGVLLVCLAEVPATSKPSGTLETTMAFFRQVPCLEEAEYRYHRDTIRALSYGKMRALRSFCSLETITAAEAVDSLEHLVFFPLSFNQVRLLERFAELPGAEAETGWQLLEQTRDLDFTASEAVEALPAVEGMTVEALLQAIARVKALDDPGRWAVKALFSVPGLDAAAASSALDRIEKMGELQRWAAEQACLTAGAEPVAVLRLLSLIGGLEASDAVNSKALMALDGTTAEEALFWLDSYFSRPRSDADSRFYGLDENRKTTLLAAFSSGATFLIRTINDLHSVTDRYGAEIGIGTLLASSPEALTALFDRLHPRARTRYEARLHRALAAGERPEAVRALREATALARRLTAEDLSSANLYILLSHGSELYDSSFRDILVPVLLKRLETSFNADLLDFLLQTDPDNAHVSDFIVSCAQKGKLTSFFPTDAAAQLKVLDLLAASAFANEQSLILFAATFSTLLEKLQPPARTYLIRKMTATISRPDSTFALQLRVILQYYFNAYPDLLSETDKQLVAAVIRQHGRVDLVPFQHTDFERWKADGRLASLSVFQHDDDGRYSYLSNSRYLRDNGYRPRISSTLSLLAPDSAANRQAASILERERRRPGGADAELYTLSVRAPVIVEWYKRMNGLELSHSVTVYQDEVTQRRLLHQFIAGRLEMFAQRGHSYWREEQLLEPMRDLLESGEIAAADFTDLNRFLSIGSCGGLRVYSELNRLFDNTIDIFATVGTGKAEVNDPYNLQLFEIIAASSRRLSWEDVAERSSDIFAAGRDSDYLQPGSLPAILHKMMDTRGLN